MTSYPPFSINPSFIVVRQGKRVTFTIKPSASGRRVSNTFFAVYSLPFSSNEFDSTSSSFDMDHPFSIKLEHSGFVFYSTLQESLGVILVVDADAQVEIPSVKLSKDRMKLKKRNMKWKQTNDGDYVDNAEWVYVNGIRIHPLRAILEHEKQKEKEEIELLVRSIEGSPPKKTWEQKSKLAKWLDERYKEKKSLNTLVIYVVCCHQTSLLKIQRSRLPYSCYIIVQSQ